MANNYNELLNNLETYDENDLIQIIYVSQYSGNMNSEVFNHIYTKANEYNQSKNITGFLCNGGKYFLQYLEGTKKNLLILMKNIFADNRHKKVKVVAVKKLVVRDFTRWDMRSLNMDKNKWTEDFERSFYAQQLKNFLPFRPYNWQGWFTEHFVDCIKNIDNEPSFTVIPFNQVHTTSNESSIKSYLLLHDRAIKAFFLFMLINVAVLGTLNLAHLF